MTIGKRIRKLRLDANMQANTLADIIGVSHATLSNWERDVHRPHMYHISIIASTFNVTIDYVMFGEEASINNLIVGKTIELVTVSPRVDGTGYYFEFKFTDHSKLRVTDKILFKNIADSNFKEVIY